MIRIKGESSIMKKSIIIFVAVTVLSIGMTVYGWAFVNGQVGKSR